MRADLIGEDGVVERIFAGYGVSFRVLARFDGECEACEDMFEHGVQGPSYVVLGIQEPRSCRTSAVTVGAVLSS